MLKQKIMKSLRTNWYLLVFGSSILFLNLYHAVDSTKINNKCFFNIYMKVPFYFIVNFFIVLTSLSVILVTKRKVFTVSLITFLWGFLSLANAIVTHFRGTPLMFSDVFLIKESD